MTFSSQTIWQEGFCKSCRYGRTIVGYLTRKFKESGYDFNVLRAELGKSYFQDSCSATIESQKINAMSIQERARAILDAKDSTEEYKSIAIVFPLLIAFIAVALSLAKDQKDLGGIVQLFLWRFAVWCG